MNGELELSLAVVGIGYDNADGGNRRFELALCVPGEAVELRLEPTNEHDPLAIAVFSARGVQLGYLSAERCAWIGGMIRSGVVYAAIFQELLDTSAAVRARFGGGAPTLPGSARPEVAAPPAPRRARVPFNPDAFCPDPDPGMWGA